MHVGNLRTALYSYLIAKHAGGTFMLRIEDTDQNREMEGAVDIIKRTMLETGLIPDEGPDNPGTVGPYVQSERVKAGIYMKYAKMLIEKGEAYYCFCTQERLDSLRREVDGKEIMMYDKHCLHLSKEEIEANLKAGKPFVIRQNVPNEGTTKFEDEIYGTIEVPNEELDDMVLIKSDGYPTYNFANVVDDHLMGITHVVRGNEYLSSAPKYNRLYKAFGWEVPTYVHCPLITDEEHHKLSKRSGHSSFEDLLDAGFVSEAIVNYVALLGWSPEDDREIFSLQELVENFDYHRMSKSPAVFDMKKMRWMNGEYIKAMAPESFYERALPEIRKVVTKDLDLKKIADMVKTRIEVFPDIDDMVDFFEELPEYDVTIRGAVSIARRVQDPLAELVKIEPKAIGVGQYQHDVNQKALTGTLDGVVEAAVNHVGVDLNTASPALLSHVAGITAATAKNIVEYCCRYPGWDRRPSPSVRASCASMEARALWMIRPSIRSPINWPSSFWQNWVSTWKI